MISRLFRHFAGYASFALAVAYCAPAHAQLLPIGAHDATVDSCLAQLPVVPSDVESGDSICLGAKLWDIEGHLIFHIDSAEHTLTKFDWSTYMPTSRPRVDTIAKLMETTLGQPDRARNKDWIYWIWDNDEVHYLLGYSTGTLRLLEFMDQGSLNACVLK